eukprot:CAMPEP_0206230866 /NCGR_PEP_ID=MMETSP0047_2-20121206/10514_1 /ASSEMBLY_ACC=CAM_ASM_000192 /TAXON_ID=195065 /ORGANISM="Chroomonas mesostigmatica_cf, Strain CCMP1168" /LENGTH=306 /DNA_ID=CAMNT_0053654371 /DNA_START=107 /DNA_END=1026 /DNA_ORIENTATION=-
MHGDFVKERDVNQLYYVYITSSHEDWQYILESKGLGKHVKDFDASEPLHGDQHSSFAMPDMGVHVLAEIETFRDIPAHVTLEEFSRILKDMLPTWQSFRRTYSKSEAYAELTSILSMVADLLSATAVSSSAEYLLSAMQMPESSPVYASVEKGSINPAISRQITRRHGGVSHVKPNTRSYRVLAIYNGPIQAAIIEERQGRVAMHQSKYTAAGGTLPSLPSAFLKGEVFDTYSAKILLTAVERAATYSGLLQLLLSAGFDLGPVMHKEAMTGESATEFEQAKVLENHAGCACGGVYVGHARDDVVP